MVVAVVEGDLLTFGQTHFEVRGHFDLWNLRHVDGSALPIGMQVKIDCRMID